MLIGVEAVTVGAVVAAAGGVIAAVATITRLVWEVQDRRVRAKAEARAAQTPEVQVFTIADMYAEMDRIHGLHPPGRPSRTFWYRRTGRGRSNSVDAIAVLLTLGAFVALVGVVTWLVAELAGTSVLSVACAILSTGIVVSLAAWTISTLLRRFDR